MLLFFCGRFATLVIFGRLFRKFRHEASFCVRFIIRLLVVPRRILANGVASLCSPITLPRFVPAHVALDPLYSRVTQTAKGALAFGSGGGGAFIVQQKTCVCGCDCQADALIISASFFLFPFDAIVAERTDLLCA